jgi:UDP-N-acetylmuramoyl-tripeptide--D-alanyl-D-alanine ligase
MMTLADFYAAFHAPHPEGAERAAIGRVVVDSRSVVPGSLFVALQGEAHDGHDFIVQALEHGAAVVIAEPRAMKLQLPSGVRFFETEARQDQLQGVARAAGESSPQSLAPTIAIVPSSLKALHQLAAYWRRRFPGCQTVGVTGSIGKSSTKELIAAVLQRRFTTWKSPGNLNNEIGLPLTLLQLDTSHDFAVVEMGMYALGEIRALCEIARPRIGVVTNVGPSHLGRLGSIERIAQAKSELVEALPDDGVAILNGDDPIVRTMAAKTRARVFHYGLRPTADLWADGIESHGLEGIAFDLHYCEEKLHVRVPLLGRHSVHTALAAASVGLVVGMPWYDILKGLQDVSAQLRLLVVPGERGTTILDDTYNASPESSLAALNLLAELSGRKIAVLGDMLELGSYEEQGHRVVGGRAAEVVEVLIAVGDRGRWIGEAAQESGLSEGTYFARDHQEAIATLRQVMRAGDMILVKGSRGAKMEQVVAAIARPSENGYTETNGWPGP